VTILLFLYVYSTDRKTWGLSVYWHVRQHSVLFHRRLLRNVIFEKQAYGIIFTTSTKILYGLVSLPEI